MGFPSCDVTAPNWVLLASVCTTNHLAKSGKAKSVSLVITCFIFLKASSCSDVHLNFAFSEVKLVKGAKISDLFGCMSLWKFTIPRRALTSFLFVGVAMLSTACIFCDRLNSFSGYPES